MVDGAAVRKRVDLEFVGVVRPKRRAMVEGEQLDAGGRAVILFCAATDRAAVAPAVEQLGRRGVWSTLVSGVVVDPNRFQQELERHGTNAFYVLCRSPSFDRVRVTKCQMLLLRAGVSEYQIVSVQLSEAGPESVVNPVCKHIEQFGRRPATSSGHGRPAFDDFEDDEEATTPFRLQDIVRAPDPPPAEPAAPPIAEESSEELQPAPDLQPVQRAPSSRGRFGVMHVAIGAFAVLGIAGLAAVLVGGDDADETETRTVASAAVTPASIPPTAEVEEPAPQAGREPVVALPSPTPAADAEPDLELEPEPEPPPEQAPSAAASPAPGGAPGVLAALQSGKVRALDSIVYAAQVSKYDDYDAALAYCDALQIDGLSGWRLPTSEELITLVKPKLIKRARYWTSSSTKRSAQLFEGKSRRTKRRKRSYGGGRALCVLEAPG